ncbi:hypothetical protein A3F28_02380 [Candidatus Uhrbacteria bacterium RIFCSPHIGHO2_12_FULL_57_11]|uniref:Haloacid dehalogenase n=1 Tax=Candidatus Uhrbacteria bacterium RIFCSPHIGHO2_12_FULL_57_11 TaxID=1802398 RepID=A0A1F7UNF8_9BACT|nr:MAG: hypothetical protein A3F28_02380 [Candidatus Uhrbacteria bacterium RIFCSPHIGHO2_12_FULL_57_11]
MDIVTSPRIEAMVFDAMFTLLLAKGSRRKMMAKIFLKHLRRIAKRLGIKFRPSKGFARRLMRITKRVREATPPTQDYGRDWSRVNRRIAAEMLGVSEELVLMEEGLAIHQEVLSDPDHYEVPRNIREMLKLAKKLGFRLAIASNQNEADLLPMLAKHKIGDFFEKVLCSDKLGICKPDPDFFKRAYAEIGVASESVCYIGNSIRNDLSAAWIGSRVVLIDYDGGLKINETGGGLYLVKVVRNIEELCDWLGEQAKSPIKGPAKASDAAVSRRAVNE